MSTLRADAAPFNPFMFRGPFSSMELNNSSSPTTKDSPTTITEHTQNPPTTNVSPLDLIQFIFTDMDREYLHSMLEATDYDIQNAVQAILKSSDEQDASMFAEEASRSQAYSFVIEEENKVRNSKIAPPPKKEEPPPAPAPVANIPKDAPICKYFLKGCCLIRNCPYKHTTLVACKFFLQGFCMRGDDCDYVHTYDSSKANQVMANISNEINQEQSTTQAANSKLSFSSNEFPSLAPVIKERVSQKKKKKKKSSTSVTVPNGQISVAPVTQKMQNVSLGQSGEMTMASKLKLLRMQETYSHVPKDIVAQTYQACQENLEQAELTLNEFYGTPASTTPAAKTTPPVIENKPATGLFAIPPKKTIYTSVPQLWVETGESLAELYEEYRTAAIDHALMRNKFFTLATQGYLSGDGASAREYSRKGRYHQQMMKELHAKASQKIFELRNPGLTVLTNGSTADLHGLHVDEALIILENLLSKVTGQLKYFYIITGTGHHSYEGKSKLLPAIIRFLDEFGCSWVDHSTDKRGGLLKVTLPQ